MSGDGDPQHRPAEGWSTRCQPAGHADRDAREGEELPAGSRRSAAPFRILYEDDDLIFVDKSPGIVVQRGYDADEPVLFEQVLAYCQANGETAFLMQRLDRGTSGVLFFSKKPDVNPNLTRQFEKKIIRKRYVALVHGRVSQRQTIHAPLARIGPISFGVRPQGKRAITGIIPLVAAHDTSFIELDLLTGRTHQIRVHMAAIDHPLIGDWLYAARDAARPMLHALSLQMRHPRTQEPLRISASISQDLLTESERRGIGSELIVERLSSR